MERLRDVETHWWANTLLDWVKDVPRYNIPHGKNITFDPYSHCHGNPNQSNTASQAI